LCGFNSPLALQASELNQSTLLPLPGASLAARGSPLKASPCDGSKFVNKNSGIPEGALRDFSLTNFSALHIRIINSKSGGKPLALRTNNQGA